jgi:hypothetical protein
MRSLIDSFSNVIFHGGDAEAQRVWILRVSAVNCFSDDTVEQRLVGSEAAKIFQEMPHQPFEFIVMPAGRVRRDVTIGRRPQRMIRWQRFALRDI